jgi:hypothetical protein
MRRKDRKIRMKMGVLMASYPRVHPQNKFLWNMKTFCYEKFVYIS